MRTLLILLVMAGGCGREPRPWGSPERPYREEWITTDGETRCFPIEGRAFIVKAWPEDGISAFESAFYPTSQTGPSFGGPFYFAHRLQGQWDSEREMRRSYGDAMGSEMQLWAGVGDPEEVNLGQSICIKGHALVMWQWDNDGKTAGY